MLQDIIIYLMQNKRAYLEEINSFSFDYFERFLLF